VRYCRAAFGLVWNVALPRGDTEREDLVSAAWAVAYIGPNKPKSSFFDPEWPIMRMLVVSPLARRGGVGRALAQECIDRARRDDASVFALHTASIMKVAQAMYERMGFVFLREAPEIFGVPYAIYIKRLAG
jgi:ribosomal protein S18 acetylase RimI-like enzyme